MKKQETVAYNKENAHITEKESIITKSNCTNCGSEKIENFCSRCGQRRYRRINRNYIVQELQNVFSATGGFLYTLIKLIRNPGKTARKFIEGQRVKHFRPLYFVFILAGFEALIAYQWVGLAEMLEAYSRDMHIRSPFMHDYYIFTSSNHSLLMLVLLPFFALCTKLAFRKWGQNYYEHIVMNAYILSFLTLLNIIIVYPLVYLLRDQPALATYLTSVGLLFLPFVLIWFFKEFYPKRPWIDIIARSLLVLVITMGVLLVLFVLAILLLLIYTYFNGTEGMLEYLRPK